MSEDGTAQAVERARPTEVGSEWETLTQMLDFLRATAVNKAAGLTDEQAFTRPLPVTELTVASVIKHLSGTERFWFSIDFAGMDISWPWTDDDPHGNFRIGPDDTLVGIVDEYIAECERSRKAIAGYDLDDVALSEGMDFKLRYALTHMVEETARHCGHLDILREQIDGSVGQ